MSVPAILSAGEIYVDLVMGGLDSWPEAGKETFAREFRREIGGGTAITACALARLGNRSEVLAAVGRDCSQWVLERLNGCGVGTGSVTVEDREPTGCTVIASRPDDRALITYAGANRYFPELLQARLAAADALPEHLHLSVPLALSDGLQVCRAIRERGGTVSLDVGWHPGWLTDRRALALLQCVDLFLPNEVEAGAMTGEREPAQVLQAFAARGVRRVALKLGSKGAALLWDGKTYFVGAHPVRCVDTTGAGDCFDAGFLHAWLGGAEPLECLRSGNICGALSTETFGGVAGSPDASRLAAELRRMDL